MGFTVGDDCGIVGGFGAVRTGVVLGVELGVGLGECDWLQAVDVEKKESSVPIVASEMSSLNACILGSAVGANRPSVGSTKSFSLGKFKF